MSIMSLKDCINLENNIISQNYVTVEMCYIPKSSMYLLEVNFINRANSKLTSNAGCSSHIKPRSHGIPI